MGSLVVLRYLAELIWVAVDTVTNVDTAVITLAHQKTKNSVIGGI